MTKATIKNCTYNNNLIASVITANDVGNVKHTNFAFEARGF